MPPSTLLIALLLLVAGASATALHPTTCLLASALARAPDVSDALRAELDVFRDGCDVRGDKVDAVDVWRGGGDETSCSTAPAPALPPAPAHRRLSTTCAFQTATSGSHNVPANCSQTAKSSSRRT